MSTILSNTNLIGRVNIRGISALIDPENWKNWNNTVKSNTLISVPSSGQLITSAELPAEESWYSWNNTVKSNTLLPAVTSGQLITSAELPAEESWHSWNNTVKSNTLIPAVTSAIEIQ